MLFRLCFLLFMSIFIWNAHPNNSILDIDFSPANRSLNGRGTSLAQGSEFYIANPAQLQLIENQEYGISYEEGLFANRYLNLYTAQNINSFPFAFSTALLIPQGIDIISNLGIVSGKANIFEIYFTFHASNKVRLGSTELWIGYGAKGLYGELEKVQYGTFVLDLSFMVPVSAKFLKIKGLKHKSYNNLFFNLTFSNFGVPIKYINGSTHAPATFDFGFNYVVLHVNSHKLDIVSGAKVYIFEGTFIDRIIPSLGLQYLLFNIAFIRWGFDWSNDQANFNVGLGVKYNIYGKYTVQVDYNLGINPSLSFTHSVGFKFSYNVSSYSDEFFEVDKLQKEIGFSYNSDLLKKLQKIIEKYYEKNNQYPSNLDVVTDIFKKKERHTGVVQPLKGFFSYNPNFGKLAIVSENSFSKEQQLELTLKDKSRLVGSIVTTNQDAFIFKHSQGELTVKKDSVVSIQSVAFKKIDINIKNLVQDYIYDYKKTKNGKCPSSLDELTIFLSQYGIEQLPQPSSGSLNYNPNNCLVSLSTSEESIDGVQNLLPKDANNSIFDSGNIQNDVKEAKKPAKKKPATTPKNKLKSFTESEKSKLDKQKRNQKKRKKDTDLNNNKNKTLEEEFKFNDE